MIPNRFIILWNNQPTGIDNGYPFKTDEPEQIKYWRTKKEAENYLDVITMHGKSSTYIYIAQIVEIQFRIVDK